ncbi:signal peptidase II [Stackebrandtia endophytica]|uniref:Lipoprotein signal peptidase n=2 Tax=Stackebrandtia endophytica TaxID=1496996 RepID=A0A543B3A2_9ACTN|nr:signal peptidase II [Stackebrandtia endophytica]
MEPQQAPSRRSRFMWLYAAVGLGIVVSDTITKILVVTNLSPGESVTVIPGVAYLFLTRNSGAAFSLATDFTWLLSSLAVLVVIAITWYAFRQLASKPWAIGLGLIAGGATGNLMDRFFRAPGFMHGHVVDFVSVFNEYGQGFPVFNVADSSLVIGVGLVILLELTGRRIDGTRHVSSQDDS